MKEHWTWNQDLLLLVLNLPLTHRKPWADTLLLWNSVSTQELEKLSVFPLTNLTSVHTHSIFINMSNLGSLGRSIQECFALFLLQLSFSLPEFYFFTVFISARLQNFKSTCVKLHRNVCKAKSCRLRCSSHDATLWFASVV